MRTEKKSHRSRMDPIVALVLIFAVLKVTGLISWSWLWVLSPIWITLLIFAAVFSSILITSLTVVLKIRICSNIVPQPVVEYNTESSLTIHAM